MDELSTGCVIAETVRQESFSRTSICEEKDLICVTDDDHYWFELKKINKNEGIKRDKIIPEVLNKEDVFEENFFLEYIVKIIYIYKFSVNVCYECEWE